MVFDLNPINVLLAVMFGAGVFALVMSLGYRPDVKLREIEKIYAGGKPELSPLQKLQQDLDRARFNLTAAEYLLTSAILAGLGGLGAYLLTGIGLAGAFGACLGALGYRLYLSSRAGKNMEVYEDELPQVVARLINGAQMGGHLGLAAEHVARFGPPLCRDDWQYIAEQLNLRVPPEQVFRLVSERRQSTLLDLVLELLLLQQQTKSPLTEVLPLIQEALAERVKTVQKARTKMKEPIRELELVAAAPFAAVLLFRFVSPQFAEGFNSLPGQLLILAGWSMTLVAFIVGYRSFAAALRRETSFSAPLPATARPAWKKEEPAPAEAEGAGPGQTPSALRGVTGE